MRSPKNDQIWNMENNCGKGESSRWNITGPLLLVLLKLEVQERVLKNLEFEGGEFCDIPLRNFSLFCSIRNWFIENWFIQKVQLQMNKYPGFLPFEYLILPKRHLEIVHCLPVTGLKQGGVL